MTILLLIFTFFLISGPVGCFDVIGYSGGIVMIHCTIPKNRGYNGYFCRETAQQCVYLNPDKSPNTWDPKGRVSLQESDNFLTVIYRDLDLQDAGSYQCGESGEPTQPIKLEMKTDQCCSGLRVGAVTGETVTISFSYPEGFKENTKFIYKLDGQKFTEVIRTSESKKDRFSTSNAGVVSVSISDVRKDDGGVYYCGVTDDEGAGDYETFFSKVHLLVEGPTYRTTSSASTAPPAPPTPPQDPPASPALTVPATPTVTTSSPGSSVINIITPVSVVVALLLIGGAALICIVILKKNQGSTPPARTNHSGHNEAPAVVSNDEQTGLSTPPPPKDQDPTYCTVSFHNNPGCPTHASVSVHKEETETEYAIVKHPTAVE